MADILVTRVHPGATGSALYKFRIKSLFYKLLILRFRSGRDNFYNIIVSIYYKLAFYTVGRVSTSIRLRSESAVQARGLRCRRNESDQSVISVKVGSCDYLKRRVLNQRNL